MVWAQAARRGPERREIREKTQAVTYRDEFYGIIQGIRDAAREAGRAIPARVGRERLFNVGDIRALKGLIAKNSLVGESLDVVEGDSVANSIRVSRLRAVVLELMIALRGCLRR